MTKTMYILILLTILCLTSCLKKMNGVESLTTNIYDSAYTGDAWFYIENAYQYYNGLGEDKIHFFVIVPSDATPGLKPTAFYATAVVNDEDLGLISAPKENDGSYEFNFDADNDGSGNFCLSMSVYVSEDSSSINTFTECVAP